MVAMVGRARRPSTGDEDGGAMDDVDIDEQASRWPDTFEPERWGSERRRRRRVVVAGCTGLALLVLVAAPAIYFHIEGAAPKLLSLPVGRGGAVGPVNGTWAVAPPSEVQYRVAEILFGQHHTAVGTTDNVRGTVTIKGATVTSAQFIVDMASVRSGAAGRDVQFRDLIMDTVAHPDGYFTLTRAIDLGRVPAERQIVDADAVGQLTLRGQSRTVSFPLRLERHGNGVDASGALTIRFALWGIPNPSFVVARVGNFGTIDVLLHLVRTSG
ncbi:MAG: YceI family protein [Acidimicrobiales bacterium]